MACPRGRRDRQRSPPAVPSTSMSSSMRWALRLRYGPSRYSSSSTTRTMAASTTCRRRPPPAGTPGEWLTVSPLPSSAAGVAGPVGLGFRVPALVISPYSTGGWVCSEVFDHTSTLKFLERRFGVIEPNISAWRRQTVGDMTSALRLGEHDMQVPAMPDPVALLAQQQQEAASLPAPTVPAVQVTPHQEPGTRPHTDPPD